MIRTRFAPSPTGFLHIGGVRTALFSWLFARKNQGKFILRIEDTDLERSTPEAITAILAGMAWLELNFDEGPFYQSDRTALYQSVLEKLLQEGKAYRCYCSKERLENLRAGQLANNKKPRYDGQCRDGTKAQEGSFVVRFKNPLEGEVIFSDHVYGLIRFSNQELDDLIIARSDGTFTYNFCVVIDDWNMEITHVIRGDDHINNTPRQINMLIALDAAIPEYAHLPMILGTDGKKLSKREGAVNVISYKEEGILPEALLNYLVRLGWSHADQEIFSRQEMIEFFGLTHLNKSAAALNPEKLLWLNQHYLKNMPIMELAHLLEPEMKLLNIHYSDGPALEKIALLFRERIKTLKEMAEKSRFFYEEIVIDTQQIPSDIFPILRRLYEAFLSLERWETAEIHLQLMKTVEEFQYKLGKLAQPLRYLLTGTLNTPSLDAVIYTLGREKTLKRMGTVLH